MKHYHVQDKIFTSMAWALARCSVLVANGESIGNVRPLECQDAEHLRNNVPATIVLRMPEGNSGGESLRTV